MSGVMENPWNPLFFLGFFLDSIQRRVCARARQKPTWVTWAWSSEIRTNNSREGTIPSRAPRARRRALAACRNPVANARWQKMSPRRDAYAQIAKDDGKRCRSGPAKSARKFQNMMQLWRN